VPTDRVVRLDGASPEAIELALADLPHDAPAVVTYQGPAIGSSAVVVTAVLGELEDAALDLFPAWLPAAGEVHGSGGAGVDAVRILAGRKAAASHHFGPFLADLAEAALCREKPTSWRFAAETRAAGLSRVIADSFGREHAVILLRLPDQLPPSAGQALVDAGRWLTHHGGFGVWLTSADPAAIDEVERVEVHLPEDVSALAGPDAGQPPAGTVTYPALAGRPRPGAEQWLEQALVPLPWAAARQWNKPYRTSPLVNQVVLDLVFEDARCVVEVDGPEHRTELRYAHDRQRDVRLQVEGYAVLRFTNRQVLTDVQSVVALIERLVQGRRLGAGRG
jgi:very-short-patch-repair endonuclease